MVDCACLENRSPKGPGVRIPLPPPLKFSPLVSLPSRVLAPAQYIKTVHPSVSNRSTGLIFAWYSLKSGRIFRLVRRRRSQPSFRRFSPPRFSRPGGFIAGLPGRSRPHSYAPTGPDTHVDSAFFIRSPSYSTRLQELTTFGIYLFVGSTCKIGTCGSSDCDVRA